jgi:tetratricopeptide (TPR) repeat protein
MEYLKTWRAGVAEGFSLFSDLLKQDGSISLPYGVVAGALLWPVRHDGASPQLAEALADICAAREVEPLLHALSLLGRSEPLASAQALSREARDSEAVRAQLNRLLEYFRDDWLSFQLLRPAAPDINISGSVEGANIVIGGVQYVAGDMVISQTLMQQKVRACPTAPNPPPHFAGRRAELEQLKESLGRSGSVAITGIQGMGGIGKTALALQLAAELDGVGAVLWASLGPSPTTVNHLLNWARHADPAFEAGEDPLEVLAGRVQANLTDLVRERCPGRVLVILDDVWEGDSVAAARVLQKAAPAGAAFLVTTRSQLAAAQLRSARFELRPMSPDDALALLRTLLSAYPSIPEASLLELAVAVGHHPLAMELAAGQVMLLERPEDEIVELIARYKGGIPEGSPFRDIRLELGEAREDNLELVLSFSYDSLGGEGKAHFRALGVLAYAAPFDRPLCRAVWGKEPKPALDTLRYHALLGLADAGGWYQQHPLLRAYARALLKRTPQESERAAEGYTEYVLNVTEQFNALPLASWDGLDPYVPHVEEVGRLLVEAAGAGAQGPGPDEKTASRALSFALNTSRLLSNRRQLDHTEWLEMGLAVSRRRRELRYSAFFLNEIGRDNYFRSDTLSAIRRWHEAQQVAESAGDKPSLAQTYTNLGVFYLSSDPSEAPNYLRPAVKLYEALGDTPGLVGALVNLAEWYAFKYHPYEQREQGVPLLRRALSAARAAGYEQGEAEVKLRLGRLHDTLGEREEALTLLTEAVGAFEALGRRDEEGTARLFLASAEANEGRHEEAREQLEKALPLFKTTGYRPGQAVALRNLAELHAHRGSRELALAHFAEALPLVRKSSGFLQEDADEVCIAAPFFSAQLEDVVKLQLVAQFRARAAKGFPKDAEGGGAEGGDEEQLYFDPMPDDMLRYLVVETARVQTSEPGARTSWVSALRDFASRVSADGPEYEPEAQFARALLDVTFERHPAPPEEHPYAEHVKFLLARLDFKKGAPRRPLLPPEAAEQHVKNTLAVRLVQPESRREWMIRLREQRRSASMWGDDDERDFYSAQLALLSNRLRLLRPSNVYHAAFQMLLSQLAQYEPLSLDNFLEGTVSVLTVMPERADAWLGYLRRARLDAVRYGEDDEREFFDALVALVERRPAEVRNDSPYLPHLERARRTVASGIPLFVPVPKAVLASMVERTIEVMTTLPKGVDVVIGDFLTEVRAAEQRGRLPDVELFEALLDLLTGGKPSLPRDHIYRPVLEAVLNRVRRERPRPAAAATIPQSQVEAYVRMVVDALTSAPETLERARDMLSPYRRLLEERGTDWAQEHEFIDALLVMLSGHPARLAAGNPYRLFVEQAAEEVSRYHEIREKGGMFPPSQLDELLRETAEQWRGVRDFMSEQIDNNNFMAMMTDHRMHDMVMEQTGWKETLVGMREEAEARGACWRHEVELLGALIAVVDSQPASVSPASPYHAAFRGLLAEIGYSHGIPVETQTAALAMSREEHLEHFRGLFSGKIYFLKKLDLMLMHTVAAKTISPQEAQDWDAALQSFVRETVQQNEKLDPSKIRDELEFIESLRGVLRDEKPTLPNGHPYAAHLRQVLEAVSMFNGRPASPHALTGDELERIYMMTSGVMTIGAEYFSQWKESVEALRRDLGERGPGWEDATAFTDALLIVLQGRPTDLPVENPYRPYLHLIQQQIKVMSG